MIKDDLLRRLIDLPEDSQDLIIEFMNSLNNKSNNLNKEPRRLKLDWIGSLSELDEKYTSVELQKKVWQLIDAAY